MAIHDSAAISGQARNMARDLVREVLRVIELRILPYDRLTTKGDNYSDIIDSIAETFEILLKERKA